MTTTTPRDYYLRAVGGVVLGYTVLASIIILCDIATWSVFQLDDLLEPGSYESRPVWLIAQSGIAFMAAGVSGLLCRRVGASPRSVIVFAAIVAVLSFFPALFSLTVPKPSPVARVGPITAETQGHVRDSLPTWFIVSQPVWLVVGIAVGSRLSARKRLPSTRS